RKAAAAEAKAAAKAAKAAAKVAANVAAAAANAAVADAAATHAADATTQTNVQQSSVVEIRQAIATLPSSMNNEAISHTFQVCFSNISQLRRETTVRLKSKPSRVVGMDWIVELEHCAITAESFWTKSKTTNHYLGVFVRCTSSMPVGWSCAGRFHFSLHHENWDDYRAYKEGSDSTTPLFNAKYPSWGIPQFMAIETLFNSANGYVKNDAIFLTVKFNTF
ncbi:hypothetical protein PFISCL1PPCAC_9305, partial [Pristionchus fissidentatus]